MFNEHTILHAVAANFYTYTSLVTHKGHLNVYNYIIIS